MPRNRSVRVAALGSPAQRTATSASGLKSRSTAPLVRRAVAAGLVVASLALLSVYFTESDGGPLHDVQSAGAAVLRPFESVAERVASPFQDAADWFGGLLDAKSENAELRQEVERLRQQLIQRQTAIQENQDLKRLLRYRDSARFPRDYRAVAARVISRPPAQFVQQVVITAGSNAGVRVHAPVVTADGLVGQVTRVTRQTSLVTLLSDETSAASALDVKTRAAGIVRHDDHSSVALIMDRVTKDKIVNRGDIIVTAGSDIYPKGLPIGVVTYVSQTDIELHKNIQLEAFVDFDSLESLLVLVPRAGAE